MARAAVLATLDLLKTDDVPDAPVTVIEHIDAKRAEIERAVGGALKVCQRPKKPFAFNARR
jgi:hypothetical protein